MFTPSRIAGPIVALTASLASAQLTWIVDGNRGAGFHFAELTPAITWASPGDTILVRAGTYSSNAELDYAVRLLGEGEPALIGLTIRALPAGSAVTLSGFGGAVLASSRIVLRDCRGTVHLEDWRGSRLLQVDVQGCDAVTVAGVPLGSSYVATSRVTFTDCTFRGTDALVRGSQEFTPPVTALEVGSGSVTLAQCHLQGGGSGPGFRSAPGLVILAGASLSIGGDAASVVAAGLDTGGLAQPAIVNDGALVLDPLVTLLPNPSAAPIRGTGSVTMQPVATLAGRGAAPGGQIALTLRSTPGNPYGLLLSAVGPVLATPWGDLWLDPATMLGFAQGTQGSSGSTAASLRVPAVPSLRGLPVAFQGIDVAGSVLRLSSGLVVVLD
jgi:hypothetical protein